MSGLEFFRFGLNMMPQRTLPVASILAATFFIAKIWRDSTVNKPAEDLDYPVIPLSAQSQVEPEEQPKDDLSITSLSMAVAKGNVIATRRILAEGADINQLDQAGDTPLHQAIQVGTFDIIATLLAHPAIRLDIPCGEYRLIPYQCVLYRMIEIKIEQECAKNNSAALEKQRRHYRKLSRTIRLAMLREEEVQEVVTAVTSEAVPAIAPASEQGAQLTAAPERAERKRVRFQLPDSAPVSRTPY